ncbi:MAG: tetratricopeptide repeat protein [Candidatus Eremiobacteraeota bacterium]|nr:tetratricopeptide repeat protein [Candidatus Eremiobacteraeota bacterium]MCW5872263.1 tetratricopeptide repeat protein [Candidatus Eremiobacteraeota bacterium]
MKVLMLLVALCVSLPARAQVPAPASYLEQTLQFVLDGQVDSALEMLNRYIEENPIDPRGYRARGAFLANLLKDPEYLSAALSDYNRVLSLSPEQNNIFWLQRGRLLHRLDRHREAIPDLDRFIAGDPGFPEAYYLRARSQWLLGNGKLACQDLDQALQLSPLMSEAYGLRGIVHLQLGQPAAGRADLQQAVELNPNSPYAKDLESIRQSKPDAGGLSWLPFVSPEKDFQVELPMPVRTTVRNDQFMVASALGAGHMFGVIRHPHDAESRLWKVESEDCRQAVFTFLEVSGGRVVQWKIETYAGRRCLHACLRGSDGAETDVLVVLARDDIYLVAAVRPLDSPPFETGRRDRFFRSFRLLK